MGRNLVNRFFAVRRPCRTPARGRRPRASTLPPPVRGRTPARGRRQEYAGRYARRGPRHVAPRKGCTGKNFRASRRPRFPAERAPQSATRQKFGRRTETVSVFGALSTSKAAHGPFSRFGRRHSSAVPCAGRGMKIDTGHKSAIMSVSSRSLYAPAVRCGELAENGLSGR